MLRFIPVNADEALWICGGCDMAKYRGVLFRPYPDHLALQSFLSKTRDGHENSGHKGKEYLQLQELCCHMILHTSLCLTRLVKYSRCLPVEHVSCCSLFCGSDISSALGGWKRSIVSLSRSCSWVTDRLPLHTPQLLRWHLRALKAQHSIQLLD